MKRSSSSWVAGFFLGLVATLAQASGEEWVATQRLARGAAQPDIRTSDVAVGPGMIAVGSFAPHPDGTGRVTIFNRTDAGYVPGQVLLADEGILYHGTSLALEGDLLVASSSVAGVVYVYRFDGTSWIQQQRIDRPASGSPSDSFGYSVAIANGRLLVGAFRHEDAGVEVGAVYAYEYDGSTWILRQTLRPSSLSEGAEFGFSLSAHGDTFFAGAPGQAGLFPGTGAMFVFRHDGQSWVQQQEILPPDSDVGFDCRFGTSSACEADRAFLGMAFYDGERENQGAAYVFENDGAKWVLRQRLTSSTPQVLDDFARAVALEGDLAFIGQRRGIAGDDGSGRGFVFRYDGSTWNETACVRDAWDDDDAHFAGQVGIDGETLVSVANGAAVRGAVHVHERVPCVAGSVVDAGGSLVDLLYANGSSGGADRTVVLDSVTPLEVTLLAPLSGGSGRFVLHGNPRAPLPTTEVVMPAGLGTACFEFRLTRGATPVVVANSIGRPAIIGASMFFGMPRPDPNPATTVMSYPALPRDTTLTLQAVIFNPASSSPLGASVTNAVIVRVR